MMRKSYGVQISLCKIETQLQLLQLLWLILQVIIFYFDNTKFESLLSSLLYRYSCNIPSFASAHCLFFVVVVFFWFFFFKTQFHVLQLGLKLYVKERITLNFCSSCLFLLSAGVTCMGYYPVCIVLGNQTQGLVLQTLLSTEQYSQPLETCF